MKHLTYIGCGVSTVFSVIKLLDNGYDGSMITIIEKGNNPYKRRREDIMNGFLGGGGYSDGKILYSFTQGGELIKYTGKEKGEQLSKELKYYIKKFHPKPEDIKTTGIAPTPEFIKKSNLTLKQNECDHIGTDYLEQIGKNIYDYFMKKNILMLFNIEVVEVDFKQKILKLRDMTGPHIDFLEYEELIIATGKSGMDFINHLTQKYKLPNIPKAAQIGVRFESDYKYFKKLAVKFHDFKLYKKYRIYNKNDKPVSCRTFCLPKGEKIFIKRENEITFENIEDIKTTDMVLTYNIINKKISFINPTNTFKRKYKGDIYNFNDGELRVTEEHKLFILERAKTEEKYECGDKKYYYSKLTEKDAKQIKKGEVILTGNNYNDNHLFQKIELNNVDDWMFYYIVGLWMADGSASYKAKRPNNNVTITNNIMVLKKIQQYLKEKWVHSEIKEMPKYAILSFTSKHFYEFLRKENLFMKGKERGLPKNIYTWNKKIIFALISGMVDGDGSIKEEYNVSIDYCSCSEHLVRELCYLLKFLQIKYTLQTNVVDTNFQKNTKIYRINICERDSVNTLRRELKLFNDQKNNTLMKKDNNTFSTISEKEQYNKIRIIDIEYYDGEVYDLEIPITHNFIAGKIPMVIHNCSNNKAAYVAIENVNGMKSFNGHGYKDKDKINNLTNFGIILEVKDIENPLEFTQQLVKKCQKEGKGLYYSPGNRKPTVEAIRCDILDIPPIYKNLTYKIFDFIKELDYIFKFRNDYILYLPEIKLLTNELIVNNKDLSLTKYSNVHIIGDSLSARGIFVSACQGMYLSEYFLGVKK